MEDSTEENSLRSEFCAMQYSAHDPLGLNDLTETQIPTYSYSIDEGLHNFIIPVSSSSSQFVVAGTSFSIAPLIKAENAQTSSQSFTLVPSVAKSSSKPKLVAKNTRTSGLLSKIRNQKSCHDNEKLRLECEWENCDEVYEELHGYLDHVADHVSDVPIISTKIASETSMELKDLGDDCESHKTFGCLWQGCGYETACSGDIIRHLNFHSFHTKIKASGAKMLDETKIEPCSLPVEQRNVLPQLPECDFTCQWQDCDKECEVFSEPIKYYWHVQWHAEEFRPSRIYDRESRGCKVDIFCKWANCSFKAATTSKLKEHLKSHSAERTVACPNCGGLFASRSKFLDHCQRQLRGKGLKCSYCQKTFPTERLLRDHMRGHINTLQCPFCTMTCPSATAMNKHITYRHSDERQFVCPFSEPETEEEACQYTAKTQQDLTKHLRNVHYGENFFSCDQGCGKTFRSRTGLKHHVEKVHENVGPKYCCHLCKKRFRRGNYLTAHLSSIHDYKWPPGHKKFHYAMDENGLYHVQTMRFENLELALNAGIEIEENS